MEDHEMPPAGDGELRRDYSDKERQQMAKSGEAMPDGSYPIANRQDLENAIRAVGRGNADHSAIRKHIMKRAKALGLSDLIPDNWQADGSLREQNSAVSLPETSACFVINNQIPMPDMRTIAEEVTDFALELGKRKDDPEVERRRQKAGTLRGVMEHREFTTTQMECRELGDGTLRMSGYASITEHPYEVGQFTEVIQRGAFKRTLSEEPDTVLLVNHEGTPLARTKNGSLALSEDARGLRWVADLDGEDPESRALARKVERGLIDQCSFAFLCTDDEWDDEFRTRRIKSVSLHRGDVSIVTHGANEATSVMMRSADGSVEVRALEERAGRVFSQANMQALQRVLDNIASADESIDTAQETLSATLEVQNPDSDHERGDAGADGEPDPPAASAGAARSIDPVREQRALMRARRAA